MSKVLFVATVAKKHICQFHIPYLKWFKEHGYEVHVCAKNDYENKLDCNIPYCDKFYDIEFSRSPFNFSNISVYKKLKSIIDENKYDLIHCHTPVAAAICRISANNRRKKEKMPVLYTTHGFHFFKGASKSSILYYLAEKFLIPYTDGLITINKEDFEAAKRLCKGKKCDVYYIHGMGVDTHKIKSTTVDKNNLKLKLGIPSDAFTLLSVSELNANKNLKTTINALAKLDIPSIYYVICGTGDMLEEYKSLARNLGIDKKIIFTGYRYDIFEIVHIADVFLFPSLREGLGMAPIEAMSAGVPIIASDIRGIREYAVNNKNSILLEPNDVKGFSDAIKFLCSNDEIRLKMGQNAAETVEAFDIKNSIKAMEKIYLKYLTGENAAEKETVELV